MLRKRIRESLTARIFFITALILLGAGAVTFGLIAWAAPSTYTAVLNEDLTVRTEALVEKLERTPLEDCGPVLDAFLRDSGADAMLLGPDGRIVKTGSQFEIQETEGASENAASGNAASGNDASENATSGNDVSERYAHSSITYTTGSQEEETAVTVTMSERAAVTAEVLFTDQTEPCTLYVTPRLEAENVAVRAMVQMAPWLLLTLLVFSLLCALVYSRYITRPIVRLSQTAGRMAELDFGWTCEEDRQDEIGRLGQSLNRMAGKLSGALRDLKASNEALRGEMEQERELERQRTAFFSAASHELKTPVTILKGQLSGMLDGVDVYQDREKYLARSLRVTLRMEKLIQEILTVSRMEARDSVPVREPVDLSGLVRRQLELDAELLRQRGLRVDARLCPGLAVRGNASLLEKAVGNLLSNAALYSPEGEEIRVWTGWQGSHPALAIENTGIHIAEEALPHLFEAIRISISSPAAGAPAKRAGALPGEASSGAARGAVRIENTEEGVRGRGALFHLKHILAPFLFHRSRISCEGKKKMLSAGAAASGRPAGEKRKGCQAMKIDSKI